MCAIATYSYDKLKRDSRKYATLSIVNITHSFQRPPRVYCRFLCTFASKMTTCISNVDQGRVISWAQVFERLVTNGELLTLSLVADSSRFQFENFVLCLNKVKSGHMNTMQIKTVKLLSSKSARTVTSVLQAVVIATPFPTCGGILAIYKKYTWYLPTYCCAQERNNNPQSFHIFPLQMNYELGNFPGGVQTHDSYCRVPKGSMYPPSLHCWLSLKVSELALRVHMRNNLRKVCPQSDYTFCSLSDLCTDTVVFAFNISNSFHQSDLKHRKCTVICFLFLTCVL